MATKYADIRKQLRNADQVFFRDRQALISRNTGGEYDHVGTVVIALGTRMVCHATLIHGARAETLSGLIRKYPGCIDVYRPKCHDWAAYRVAQLALRMTGKRYNVRGILLQLLVRLPVLSLLARYIPDWQSNSSWSSPKYCSEMSAFVLRRGAGLTLSNNTGTAMTTPNQLADSTDLQKLWEGLTL